MGGKPRGAASEPIAPTPEMIEKFRQVGIRLDRNGTFWHRGSPIEHPRLAQALRRWLDVRPEDGRPILRLDDKRYAYVDVDDAFLLIESIQWVDSKPIATLNDGTEEPLAADTLKVGPGFALYALVRDRRLLARLVPRAYYSLATHIEEVGDEFALRVGPELYAIGDLKSTSSAVI